MSEAQDVVKDLVDRGFAKSDVSLIAGREEGEGAEATDRSRTDAGSRAAKGAGIGAAAGVLAGLVALAIPGVGPIVAAGPLATALAGAGIGAAAGSLIGVLTSAGIPEEQAHHYAEAVRRGSALVAVKTSDERAQEAADILDRRGAINVEQRASRWGKTEGYKRFDESRAPLGREQRLRERETNVKHYDQGERVIPVVEEEVKVGKRPVQRGGVRVYTHITEQPVQENVRLREEKVNVERRPVDRPVTGADMNAMRQGTIEVTEQAEEVVVGKQARVVEEVVISKETGERVETVADTVRRADVTVEKVPGTSARTSAGQSFETYERDFRRDYESTLGRTGQAYEYYAPAYRYGYTVANDPQYVSLDWEAANDDLRQSWEARNPGTWQKIQSAVHYAFDKARGRAA